MIKSTMVSIILSDNLMDALISDIPGVSHGFFDALDKEELIDNIGAESTSSPVIFIAVLSTT